jgi:hypothetical protein
METNSQKVMAAMPSFEDFMKLAEEVKVYSVEKMKLENQIKSGEAEAFREIMTNPVYFKDGKPVAVSFYENAYKFGGKNGELVELRNRLAEAQAALELKRNQFEVYKQMHDLFKTLVYQERVLT